ncbi:MAG TPA: hypothetical protein VFD91_13315 [Mariniphaga sp.]|jgi:hypothetical protein|nr:hypothetical protein [Mariniphaga sp.]
MNQHKRSLWPEKQYQNTFPLAFSLANGNFRRQLLTEIHSIAYENDFRKPGGEFKISIKKEAFKTALN